MLSYIGCLFIKAVFVLLTIAVLPMLLRFAAANWRDLFEELRRGRNGL